ncbi:MAG: hypothetical protein ACOC8H_01105, partial [bacterium]
MTDVTGSFHGISFRVGSGCPAWLDYTKKYMAPFIVETPVTPTRLSVRLRTARDNVAPSSNRLITLGRHIAHCHEGIEWWIPGQHRFYCHVCLPERECTNTITVDICDIEPLWRRIAKRVVSGRETRLNRYMTGIREGLVIPLTALAERERGLVLLHASGVAVDGLALLFAGFNGAGKSGLALEFLKQPGAKLRGDNYVLVDPKQKRVYGFPEPVRVDPRVLPSAAEWGAPIGHAFGKMQWLCDPRWVGTSAEIRTIVLLQIGDPGFVIEHKPNEFARNLYSMLTYVDEGPGRSYFDVIADYSCQLQPRPDTQNMLLQLCSSLQCLT